MKRILPALVLLGVLVLGVLAAKGLLRNPEGLPPTEDVGEVSSEEEKGNLPPTKETKAGTHQEEEGYEAPAGMSESELPEASPSFKQGSQATGIESTEPVESGSRRGSVLRGPLARSPAGPPTPSQGKTKDPDQAQEENQQSGLIISPEQQRKLMRLYIEALTHLGER